MQLLVPELQQRRQLLIEKDGKDFALQAMENDDGIVAEGTFKKLRVELPDPELLIFSLVVAVVI